MQQLTQYFNMLSITEWLMASVALVLVISLHSIIRQRKQQKLHSLSVQLLQRDLRALANAAVGVGERVLNVERHQRKKPAVTAALVKQVSIPAKVEYYESNDQPYEQAIRMAQSGATVKDIVNVCGLSKSEAELVCMMHRLDKVG